MSESSGSPVALDPRIQGYKKKLEIAGVALVAGVAAVVVIATSGSIIVASAMAVGALAAVNAVPVFSRWAALRKQRALTALAEEFSEETIREDERREGQRIAEQQQVYKQQEAEFRNVIDDLRANMARATAEEQGMLQGQIDELEAVLTDTWATLQAKVGDLAELKRVNGIYISLHRAGKAMKRGQDLRRNADEIQRVETARQAIKTRMREALAGQKLDAMNAPLQQRLSASSVAQIAAPMTGTRPTLIVRAPEAIPVQLDTVEAQRVPHRR